MIALLRKNFTSLISTPNSSNVFESPIYFSLYLNNFCTSSEGKLSDILVHKHNFDPNFASRAASKLKRGRNPENAGLVLSFLRDCGFSDYQLEKIVKNRSKVFSASLEDNIKPKIEFFRDLGLSSDVLSKLISDNPEMLCLSLRNNIIPSVALLKRLLGSNDVVAKFIRRAPRSLSSNLENTVLSKVEFFKSFGVPLERIRTFLNRYPTCFLLKLEVLKESAVKAEEMGIDVGSKSFIYAVMTIAEMRNEVWILKWQALRSMGFSDSDLAIMFRKVPQSFGVSLEKMKKIVELLLDTKKYTISSIVDCPQSLQFSIEKRYMPRLQILGVLESRNLIEEWPCLSKVLRLTDDEFFKEYSIPCADKVRDVCSVDNLPGTEEDGTSTYLKYQDEVLAIQQKEISE